MSQKSSLYRTIAILKSLNEGKKVSVSQLSKEYEVSSRTIRRDFELIKELFGDFMRKEGESYIAYEKVLLQEILNATDLMTLANIVNLFGLMHKEHLVSEKTQALIDKSMLVYDFKSRPFENMQNIEIIRKVEHAIKFNKEIKMGYKTERTTTYTHFYPYKILFLNENFYLVGVNSGKKQFEFRRISMITEVSYTKFVFNQEGDINAFIQSIQTPWAVFGQSLIEVKIRVIPKAKRFFILKKYLPSQRVTKEYEDGSILVEYSVSNLREIEELIIKWLPQVEIISPRYFKKMLSKNLKRKMRALF